MPQIVAIALCSILAGVSMLGGGIALDEAGLSSDSGQNQQQQGQQNGGDKQDGGDQSGSSSSSGSDAGTQSTSVLGTSELIDEDGDSARAANLKTATGKLDGATIDTGATFSFRKAVGMSTQAVSNSSVVAGFDQVASALYAASLKAGLDVTERHQGSGKDSFVATGLEASVETGQNDLKIANNSASPVTIKASSEGQKVTVSIIGVDANPNVKRDFVARIVDAGDGSSAQQGTTIESYLVFYKNGVKTDEKKIATSTYGNGSSSSGTDSSSGADGQDSGSTSSTDTGNAGTSNTDSTDSADGTDGSKSTDSSKSSKSTGESGGSADDADDGEEPVNPVPSRGGISPTK